MKKLFTVFLLCLITTSAFGQWSGRKPMLGEQVNRAHLLGDFVGCWLMNEGSGTTVYDLSGNGNTGTKEANVVWVPGKYDSALNISGNDKIVIPYSSTLNWSGTDPITIIVWAKTTGVAGGVFFAQWAEIIFRQYDARPGDLQFILNDFTTDRATTNGESINDGNWHMLEGGYDGTNLYVSVDAKARTSVTPSGAYSNNSGEYRIGYSVGGASINPGTISHVFAYDRALTASEITLLYREPFCMFERDDIALMAKAAEAPPGVSVPVMYYHYVFHNKAYIFLPLLPLGLFYLRRRKCAA